MITLRQLRALVALVDTLNFHRAAERCHVTQPALSSQIAQLEAHLGVLLVERTRHRVLPTAAGRETGERARRILHEVDELQQAARGGGGPLSGTLRLGVLPTLGSYLLPHILPALRRRYPELRLYLREEPARRALDELARGELDAALVSLPVRQAGLAGVPLFFEPFWAVFPHGHPLPRRKALKPADLAGVRLILLEQGHCLRDQVQFLAGQGGAVEDPDFRATSLDSLRQMVATGLGTTILPALYVAEEGMADPQIAVRPFADPPPGRRIGLVWRDSTTRAEEFRLFAGLLREHLPKAVTPLAE